MKWMLGLLFTCSIWEMHGQNLVAVTSMSNRSNATGDSLKIVTTLGEPISFLNDQNELVISTQPLFFVETVDTTGIAEIQLLQGITVFPNPSPGIVNLERKNTTEEYSIELLEANGALLRKIPWHKGVSIYQISIQSLPAGFYVLHVKNIERSQEATFKISKR